MDNAAFVFAVVDEVKQFYETPIIFVKSKDYSDALFNAMCTIRSPLQQGSKNEVIDIIVDSHLEWLHAVDEIDSFRKDIRNLTKEDIQEAIHFTINAIGNRLKYLKKFVDSNRTSLNNIDQINLTAEMEIVEDMHKEVSKALLEKLKCYKSFMAFAEFEITMSETIDELLHWLDKIYDGFSISFSTQLSKCFNLKVPRLTGDLTKTLQQIVDDLQSARTSSAQDLLDKLKEKGKELSTMIHCTASHNLEISKVVEKINILDNRIKRLENEPTSAAVMALKNKKEYLERRLNSLDNLKTNLKNIHHMAEVSFEHVNEEELCVCEDFFRLRIFNHALPSTERERLITELCYLWDLALFGEHTRKSVISILSVADAKEEFNDELGNYFIDEHSRKIYRITADDTLYQPNENNELVPLADDKDHVYFYDECGRYFLDSKTRQRIYKAHANASEYLMDHTGVLLKIREEVDGITYFYDNYGRYYVNEEGKQIYREVDSMSEYENDGLGNLVRIRSKTELFEACPDDVYVTEDSKYLKETVGKALRICIADVIIHQPADPIKYLSERLLKYKGNMELRERLSREKEELNREREIFIAEKQAADAKAAMEAALLTQDGSEASYDSNLMNYNTMNQNYDSDLSQRSK